MGGMGIALGFVSSGGIIREVSVRGGRRNASCSFSSRSRSSSVIRMVAVQGEKTDPKLQSYYGRGNPIFGRIVTAMVRIDPICLERTYENVLEMSLDNW